MSESLKGIDVGLVHDWLPTLGGAEKVVQQLIETFPNHELYTLFNFLNDEDLVFLNANKINVSSLNSLPFVEQYYRNLLLMCTRKIEQFDVSKHDLIISSSAALSKGVITSIDQPHFCYMHSPARYAWDLSHQYLDDIRGRFTGIKRLIAKEMIYRYRFWDIRTINTIDHLIANSEFIKKRIHKIYRRDAKVIYPPVNIDKFCLKPSFDGEYYVTASRLVPYKKIDLIVKAFAKNKQRKLIVIGDGPEQSNLKSIATNNIEFVGYQALDDMVHLIQNAKAFVFAAFEDFGIVPVEAQACGTPVICFGKGGTAETVKNLGVSKPTGVHFYRQHEDDINLALNIFEKNITLFTVENCRENAEYFSQPRFRDEIQSFVQTKIEEGLDER